MLVQADQTPPDDVPPDSDARDAAADAREDDGGAAQAQSPLQLERSLDNTPWLRLQMPGHVGQIRGLAFTTDGSRLCAVGDDKCVVIWRQSEPGRWFHERTVRWQVQRGPRGRIYALSAAPGLIAIGGLGAMGQAGEVLLIDPASGQLVAPLDDLEKGHRERITSLAFSPDPQRPALASMDMAGRLVAWTRDPATGLWAAKPVAYDRQTALTLRSWRMLHPVTMVGPQAIVAPVFAGTDAQSRVRWRLQRYDLRDGTSRPLETPNDYHYFFVTALTAAPATGRLASADDAGRLFVWPPSGPQPSVTRKLPAAVTAMQFNLQGTRLLLGTHATTGKPGEVRLLETADPKQVRDVWTLSVNQPVSACALSLDGEQFAFAQGGTVEIGLLADPKSRLQLSAPLRAPLRVAFRRGQPAYDIAFGTRANATGEVPLEQVFATAALQLDTPRQFDNSDWQDPNAFRGDWNVETSQTSDSFAAFLTRRGQRQGELPLRLELHGAPSATCWIPNVAGNAPRAVAIGTNGTNNIYVFELADKGICRLLRQFRGHEGVVTSIGVSADRRYLVSGGMDGTIRVWKLADLDNDAQLVQRWGAEFQPQDGELVASNLRPDGPLFFRGLRSGDVVESLRLPDEVDGDVQITTVHEPDEMQISLTQRPWDRLVAFDFRRGRQPTQSFQMYPAWQPVVSLFVAENREWAYWTPSGYYDASFEGDKLFGWQVNRGVQQLPDFFLAAQVRQSLERPEIMARLLEQGSLEDAFRTAQEQAPANWNHVLAKQEQLKPDVQIVSPASDQIVEGESMTIRATISVPAGEQLVAPKAFVNGVTAGQAELMQESAAERGVVREYRWSANVPSDQRLLVQVLAATEQDVVGRAELFVDHKLEGRPGRRQLFIVTAGINEYRDGRLTRLEYAVDNAQNVAKTLGTNAQQLYATRAISLLDRNVTRPMWNLTLEQFAGEMSASVSADDLLVIYLSGHGLRDTDNGGYYYVTADANVTDLMSGQFGDCLSFSDFAARFAEIPCRKLVVLDTCHSGAVQPLSQRELKAALRALQDDLMFTLSATEGGQEAVEDREKRLGRFTYYLLDGLQGAADRVAGDGDREVSLDELIRYVKLTVSAESAKDPSGQVQYPTAGPLELLDHVNVPLTSAKPGGGTP
jgi:WD40 repeat protein